MTVTQMTAQIVMQYLQQNPNVPHEVIPNFITDVATALHNVEQGIFQAAKSRKIDEVQPVIQLVKAESKPREIEKIEKPILKPAVPIENSVTDDYIICLEDGRQLKTLKRHLTKLGMTPAQYRARWGLPNDYPMVAHNFSERRSALSKELGLGRKRAT